MPDVARALIVACENYPQAEDVAPQLPGTLTAGQNFYAWLVNTKKVPTSNIYVCCDTPLVADHPAALTFRSDRAGIVRAIDAICEAGRNQTTTLFAFFSGHGVGFQISPQQRGVDILLASDYQNRRLSGASCIRFDELRTEMRGWLGGLDHYYFLDACRTVMNAGEIQPTGLGLTLSLADSKDPTTYVLYAARFGEPAGVNSGFAPALLDGLTGAGRAKRRTGGKWFVQFDRVQRFVQERVTSKTDLLKEGPGEGLILEVPGTPMSPCTVTVTEAKDDERFELTIGLQGLTSVVPFQGASFSKDLMPSDDGYQFTLAKSGIPYRRVQPPENQLLDLFEPTDLHFSPRAAQPFESLAPVSGIEVDPAGPSNLAVQLRQATTGNIVATPPSDQLHWVPLPPGDYIAEVTESGRVARSKAIRLEPGERKRFDVGAPPLSRVQRSIAATLPNRDRLPDASETLGGPLVDQDTSLWLTIAGASRIIDHPSNFSKLRKLELATFDDLQKGDSAIFVLAGLESGDHASVMSGDDGKWQSLQLVNGLSGVFQLRERSQPGSRLVSFAIPNMPPVTYVTYALPNRVALLVFDVRATGQIVMRQMLLPVYSLQQYLDPFVSNRLVKERLALVKYLTLAQELFANRQSLDRTTPGEANRRTDLLSGKWIDPLFAIMTVFDVLRRGQKEQELPALIEAVDNLDKYFGELPDVQVVRSLLDQPSRTVPGTPLLFESLLRRPELKKSLPLNVNALDYSSMWTSWWGAVKPPQ
jgi:hypothetical protein